MRFWGPNIRISGEWIQDSNTSNARQNSNAGQYESDTQDVLRNISRNIAGRSLLDAFTASTNYLTIRALTPAAVRKTSADSIFGDRAQEAATGYHGAGSNSTIWYDPNTWKQAVFGHVYRAEDTLFHECVHALRQIRGRWRAVPVATPGWDNREELYATLLTNIYASSEHRNHDMRSDHSSVFKPLTQTDTAFHSAFSDEIADLRWKMDDVYSPIAMIPNCWNPLRVADAMFYASKRGQIN